MRIAGSFCDTERRRNRPLHRWLRHGRCFLYPFPVMARQFRHHEYDTRCELTCTSHAVESSAFE